MAALIVTILIILGAIVFGCGFQVLASEDLKEDPRESVGDRLAGVVCLVFCGGIGTGGVALAGAGMQDGPVSETMFGMIIAAAGYGFAWLRFRVLTSRN